MTGVMLAGSAALVPVAAAAGGAALTAWRRPGAQFRSIVQHFASGVVFAVVGVEILPEVKAAHSIPEVVGGFAAGVVLLLGLKAMLGGHGETHAEEGEHPEEASGFARYVPYGVDIAIDGLLLGIGFAAGAVQGGLLTFGLAAELLALGLAVAAAELGRGAPTWRVVAVPTALSSLLLVGAVLGSTLLAEASADVLAVVLSFGCAALLYLATEELLVEAHEVEETHTATAMFFVGFLLVLVIGMMNRGAA
ncbi:MAG: transporter [Myxococcota bacterium]